MNGSIQWKRRDLPAGEAVTALAARMDLPEEIAALVLERAGSPEAAEAFLNPFAGDLSDPFELPGMDAAVDRIRQAIRAREPITVFGDYDADGITGTVLLVRALQQTGAVVKPFFPSREREGYGLTPASVTRCLTFSPKPKLLITVDCGITSVDEVERLKRDGVEVIVTDHHALPEKLPDALACVNPRRLPEGAPAAGFCGCATAFLLVRALELSGESVCAEDYLDLAAVATISDVMELTDDNRRLVARGLRAIAERITGGFRHGNPGLTALVKHLKIRADEMTAERIAFSVTPCINAASRMGDGEFRKAYMLLGLGMKERAEDLVAVNEARKACERDLFARIKTEFEAVIRPGRPLAVGGENCHAGVIGIVSARLMEEVHAPVAVISTDADGGGHGSMRTCGEHDAVAALRKLDDLLDHYGGHTKAAGFTLKPGAFKAFCERFADAFDADAPVENVQFFDLDLTHRTIDLAFCEALAQLEPFGNGNPKPRFRAQFLIRAVKQISNGAHAVFELEQTGIPGLRGMLKAIWFRRGATSKLLSPGETVEAVFTLSVDRFNPTRIHPQLQIADLWVE